MTLPQCSDRRLTEQPWFSTRGSFNPEQAALITAEEWPASLLPRIPRLLPPAALLIHWDFSLSGGLCAHASVRLCPRVWVAFA